MVYMIMPYHAIGWAAAFCAMIFNGSFAIPVKSERCKRLDIDPLVFQTYKTVMCLISSYAIVWYLGLAFTFSPWGT